VSVGSEVFPQKGDWFFGVTHRGGTPVTREAIVAARQAGAFTVQVSGRNASEVPEAHHVLWTIPQERVEPHTASVTAAICAVTSLVLGAKAVEEWDALRSIGDPDLETLRDRAGEGPTVLLGEWEGEWLAREGALKLLEMADLPVRVYGSEEFFHGPRFCYSREKDRVWHISMPKDSRNSMIRASHRIGIYGATPLAWIPALVELQWLALAVALNRGFDPDRPALSTLEM
jgi:fructoselysine-6-P-deglycase FrlB-like protein